MGRTTAEEPKAAVRNRSAHVRTERSPVEKQTTPNNKLPTAYSVATTASTSTRQESSLSPTQRINESSSFAEHVREDSCERVCECHESEPTHVDADGKLRWTGGIEEVPDYQQVPFVLSYYRLNTHSFLQCIASVFWIHNETFNIWTHLGGLIYFIHMTYVWWHTHTHTHSFDALLVLCLSFASCYCMFASATFHAMSCASLDRHRCCLSFDLSGISITIGASFFSAVNLAFRCHTHLQIAYSIQAVCVMLAFVLLPRFKFFLDPEHKKWRVAAFVSIAFSGAIPIVHFLYVCTHTQLALFAQPLVLMPICYLCGVCVFLLRIPERWWPGAFDVIGMSHNIWHTFVFLAAYVWLRGSMLAYDYIHTPGNDYCAA